MRAPVSVVCAFAVCGVCTAQVRCNNDEEVKRKMFRMMFALCTVCVCAVYAHYFVVEL